MSVPLWVTDTAARFWATAGSPPPFPRDLRRPVAMALPLAVVFVPGLRVRRIEDWLGQRGITRTIEVRDRALRACLVAREGCGLVFLDGTDREDELRFSLAHEAAHYLRDYALPRQQAIQALGPQVVDVLDGRREPLVTERIDGLLARTPVGAFTHLMERGPVAAAGVERVEHEADALAYELLAPAEAVLAGLSGSPDERRAQAVDRLRETFGLPAAPAAAYASALVPVERTTSFIGRLWASPDPLSNS